MYKLVKSPTTQQINAVQKEANGFLISIPLAPDNTDYQEYLKWVAEGGVPLPADD
jgi:N-acetylglucosamine-6-phosphate deacetylase